MTREEAFVNLIKEHEGVIFKITTIYTNHPSEQQDLYQEIVYQLWKGFDSFRNEAKFSTWMYRVAMNTAISQLKKQKKMPDAVPMDQLVLRATEQYDPVFEERIKLLYSHIKALDVVDKGIVLLFLEGKKYQEIAAITGLSGSNIGTRLSRIRSKLKNSMVKEV